MKNVLISLVESSFFRWDTDPVRRAAPVSCSRKDRLAFVDELLCTDTRIGRA
jgi:hypothetical protein